MIPVELALLLVVAVMGGLGALQAHGAALAARDLYLQASERLAAWYIAWPDDAAAAAVSKILTAHLPGAAPRRATQTAPV